MQRNHIESLSHDPVEFALASYRTEVTLCHQATEQLNRIFEIVFFSHYFRIVTPQRFSQEFFFFNFFS